MITDIYRGRLGRGGYLNGPLADIFPNIFIIRISLVVYIYELSI